MPLKALSASWFVGFLGTQQDASGIVGDAVGVVGGGTADDADGVELGDVLGDGHELGDRLKGDAPVVGVESGDDHAAALAGERLGYVDETVVEELAFVDTHDLRIADEQEDLIRCIHHDRGDRVLVVRDDGAFGEPGVYGGFENLDALPGDPCALQAADEFLGFPTEHGSTDDFDPAAGLVMGEYLRFHAGENTLPLSDLLNHPERDPADLP